MAQSLVVIGERFEGGDSAVFIERTSAPDRVLSRLQRWAPRELMVLTEIAQAGGLLDKLTCHPEVGPHRLRSRWFDLGPGAVEIVRRVAAEVDDRVHSHPGPPSDSMYSNQGCRHPDCQDAHKVAQQRRKARREAVVSTIGDKDQLPSSEAGQLLDAVVAPLVDDDPEPAPVPQERPVVPVRRDQPRHRLGGCKRAARERRQAPGAGHRPGRQARQLTGVGAQRHQRGG